MEEKSMNEENLSYSSSDWNIRRNILKNHRNYRQLQNRLVILDMEKQKKIKSIQRKLATHKKMIQVKVEKFKLYKQIENNTSHNFSQQGKNSRLFKQIRLNRRNNIKSRSHQIRQSKHRLFIQIKKQKEQNKINIKHVQQRQLFSKTEKRNHVRLIQIQSRENVINYWNQRLNKFKQNKKKEILKKINYHAKYLTRLLALQKCENTILQEIKQTEQVQCKIMNLMEQEISMVDQVLIVNQL